MAFIGVYHFAGQRGLVILFGNTGTVSGKDLFRSKKKTDIYCKRGVVSFYFPLEDARFVTMESR